MGAQLTAISAAAREPHIIVQVLPFSAGAHAGMQGSFFLLDFPNPHDPELVFIDCIAGDLFLETEPDVRRFAFLLDNLRAIALSPDDSASLIDSVAQEGT